MFCDCVDDYRMYRIDRYSPCFNHPVCGRIGALGAGCEGNFCWHEEVFPDDFLGGDRLTGAQGLEGPETVYAVVSPNPAKGIVTIRYALAHSSVGSVHLYDVTGRLVRSYELACPKGTVTWDSTNDRGESVGSGIYFMRLVAGERIETKRVVLVK